MWFSAQGILEIKIDCKSVLRMRPVAFWTHTCTDFKVFVPTATCRECWVIGFHLCSLSTDSKIKTRCVLHSGQQCSSPEESAFYPRQRCVFNLVASRFDFPGNIGWLIRERGRKSANVSEHNTSSILRHNLVCERSCLGHVEQAFISNGGYLRWRCCKYVGVE